MLDRAGTDMPPVRARRQSRRVIIEAVAPYSSGVFAIVPAEKYRQLADICTGLGQPVRGVMPAERQDQDRYGCRRNEPHQCTAEQPEVPGGATPVAARKRVPGKILPAAQRAAQQPFQVESGFLDGLMHDG